MDLFNFDPLTFFSFLLTLMRVSILTFLMPFFGGDTIPATIKVMVCLVLSLAIWPQLSLPGWQLPAHGFDIALIMLGEVVLGLTMGLVVHFIFAGIQTGGEILGFQMGFTMVSVMDPVSGARISATSHFLYMISLILFLIFDGHLHLLRALALSFELIPAGSLFIGEQLTRTVIELSGQIFVLAIKIAAPVMAALFMVELTLALMGRAAPQMNLMTLGFPIKIAVGFFFLSMLFSIMAGLMEELIVNLGPMFANLMRMSGQ